MHKTSTILTVAASLILSCVVSAQLQDAYVKASNTDPNDLYGYSVGVSGDTMVVGANLNSKREKSSLVRWAVLIGYLCGSSGS